MATKFKGLKEVSVKLKQMPVKLRGKTLDKATAAGARVIRDRAKNTYAPVYTGNLRRSIVARKDRAKSSSENSVYNVGWLKKNTTRQSRGGTFDYAEHLELGWKGGRQPAQPFLRPAFEVDKERAIDAMVKIFRKVLKT